MILSIENIRFSYNSHPVLSGVTFEVGRGRVLGILGVNGAGKSTLLKCLDRILSPQADGMRLDGEDLLKMNRRDIARKLGYVPQKSGDSRLTVYESILLGRRPHIGWSVTDRDYALVEDIIRQMGLEAFAPRPVSDLSGGEAQKVLIASALAQSPKVLLLDEPTSNLDVKNQLEVMELIRRIVKNHGLAAVVSIHDLNLALRFADDLLLLKDHKVRFSSPKAGLTAEMIREVYGIEVVIQEVGGHPVVAPL